MNEDFFALSSSAASLADKISTVSILFDAEHQTLSIKNSTETSAETLFSF